MKKRIKLRRYNQSTRKIFVVDIENAVGAGVVCEKACRKVMERIYQDHKFQTGDLIVIGVSHSQNFFAVKTWNESVRVVAKWGHDGADLALEKVLEKENIEKRFSEVVIVSGDGLFAAQAAYLRAQGVKVTVDSRITQLSRFLALNCTAIRLAPSEFAA